MRTLARMAARLGGRDPDEHVTMTLADVVAFNGPAWRYPDFLMRAEAAYVALTAGRLVLPKEMNGDAHPILNDNGDGLATEEGAKSISSTAPTARTRARPSHQD